MFELALGLEAGEVGGVLLLAAANLEVVFGGVVHRLIGLPHSRDAVAFLLRQVLALPLPRLLLCPALSVFLQDDRIKFVGLYHLILHILFVDNFLLSGIRRILNIHIFIFFFNDLIVHCV